jgi:zinc transporter
MRVFAYLDDGMSVRAVPPAEAAAAHGVRLAWLHLDARDDATRALLAETLALPDIVVSALTAVETRPRCDLIANGAIVNLRGLSLEEEDEPDPLVSIRIWTERGRIVSVGRYMLKALPTLEAAMQAGSVRDPGDFVAMLADAITLDLDPHVAAFADQLDDCELMLDARQAFALRRIVATTRSKAIGYRRFVAPQREAIARLSAIDVDWLDADDRLHLREAADRFARMSEELDSVRERAALLAEQITDLRAELIDTRSLWLSVVALIFLPLTFLTGLLGMNVRGIPYAEEPWAFAGVVGVCLLTALVTLAIFMWSRWLR